MNPMRWLASSGLLVLILCCFRLPTSLAGGSEEEQNAAQQYKPKSVLVDVKDNTAVYNIPYSVGAHWNAACEAKDECDDPQGPGKITEALLYMGDSGHVQQLPHDDQTFNVTLQGESFTETGVEYWTVSYKYETDGEVLPPYIEHCKCQVNLSLIIVVDDYKLKLLSSNGNMDILETSTTDEIQIRHSERNVSLLCSSGLSDKFSSRNIPVTFTYHSKHGSDHRKVSATCDNDDTVSVNNGKWTITRTELPPYDCVLTIVGFVEHNAGKYRCAGVLSPNDSIDWSNSLHLKLQNKLQPTSNSFSLSQLGHWATIFFGIIVTSIAAIILGLIAIVNYSAYKHYKRRRQHLFQDLPRFLDYGSTESVRRDNNLSRTHTPIPNNQAENQPLVQYSNSEDDRNDTEMESSIDRPRSVAVQQEPGRGGVIASDSSDISSEDSDHHGALTDNQLTDMARAGKEGTPPCHHRGVCDKMLTCRSCKKSYCVHQSEFFTQHEKTCQGAMNSTSESESGPPGVPHISSESNLPAVIHQEPASPGEVHCVMSPTTATAAGHGVDQLK